MEKKTYYAQQAGWILGEERTKGEAIEATPEEAKYALMNATIGTEKPLTNKEQRDLTAQANAAPQSDPAADPAPATEVEPEAKSKSSGK